MESLYSLTLPLATVTRGALITENVDTHPSDIDYASSRRVHDKVPIPKDPYFQTSYERGQELGLDWVRCVQHWDRSTLDVVCGEEYPHHLARKTITAGENDRGYEYAQNEAEILRKVKHPHIVTLHGTYRQGDTYALLYEPAANFDLRSYMDLAELEKLRARDLPVDISFLNTTFGCLADALACVHAAGYDHGDIRPGNILVDNDRIFFSGFHVRAKDPSCPRWQQWTTSSIHRYLWKIGTWTTSRGRDREQPWPCPEFNCYSGEFCVCSMNQASCLIPL